MVLTIAEMEEDVKKKENITMNDIQQNIQALLDYGEAKVNIEDIIAILSIARTGIEQANKLK